MDASMLNAGDNLKVSISARLIAALCYIIPPIGAALSSLLMLRMFWALAENESAGIEAVMGAVKEASLPSIISLYLAAVVGIALIIVLVVRMTMQTKTASPPLWFFAFGGVFCLVTVAIFWIAKWFIIEALSPGSSIGEGGLGSLGASISQLLTWSIIAVPMAVVFLIAASVLLLSSRSKTKWLPLAAAIVIEILLIAVAIALPILINEPQRKNESVNLPEAKYAFEDTDIDKETSAVLILTADHKLYERKNIITKEELPQLIERLLEGKTPDKRIVYFKGDVDASFENVAQVFNGIRKADLDKVGLVVTRRKKEDNSYQLKPLGFEVKLPLEPREEDVLIKSRPNPLTLVAKLEKSGRLMLNSEDMGEIYDTGKLAETLLRIFKDRENNGVFREGTNEVEKTVSLKVSRSVRYGDFIKLVEAVKIASANPIGIQIDNLD
jgi:biopolymer transport protein ExbD